MTDPLSSPSPAAPLPSRLDRGMVVGRYEIDGWVRDGGMASLYRGHHVKTGARVALKIQHLHGPEELVTAARFDREGEVMGRLSGVPHVVQVHDVDTLPDGRRYLAMEWIEGDNLEELLDDLRNDDRRIELPRACRLLQDIALALDAVHRVEVVHRDLKPANIMIDRRHPDREVARLVDFGISADLGAGGQTSELTATGVVLGTSGYVAPEQAVGLPADPGFDLYSFGVVMFETLTGYPLPPEGMGPEQLPPVTELRPSTPAALAELVSACLQRDPTRRPASARAIVERLGEVIEELEQRGTSAQIPVESRAQSPAAEISPDDVPVVDPPPTQPQAERGDRRGLWLAVFLAAIVGGAAIVTLTMHCVSTSTPAVIHAVDSESSVGSRVPSADARTGSNGSHSEPASVTAPSSPTEPRPAADDTDGSSATDHSSATDGSSATDHSSATSETSDRAPAETSSDVLVTNGVSEVPTGPESTTGSEPTAVATVDRQCASNRRKATKANERREWTTLLRATADRSCWSSRAQREDRLALRVEALAELGRFAQCVEEGAGSTDPRVARRTKVCRNRLSRPSG